MLLLPLLFAAPALAQVAPYHTTGPIVLDGRLDEADWAQTPVVTGFSSVQPDGGIPESDTDVRFLVDETAIYVGIVVREPPGQRPVGGLVPRDETLLHDWVGVLLDPAGQGLRAYAFRVNPRGVQADGVYEEATGELWNQDLSWDGVWRAETVRTEAGWTAEIAIPWRTLRYPKGAGQMWRLIVLKDTALPFRLYAWPPLSLDIPTWLGQAALLGPLDPPPRGAAFEILPTLTAANDLLDPDPHPGIKPFSPDANPALDPGLAARFGVSSGLTVDLALNPDFSQVETDPDQVEANIKYPLYYAEKRPFFLEGADRFTSALPLLYSRSVVDPLVGARLTGQAGPVGVGWLEAWDQAPAPSTVQVDYATGLARPGWDAETVADASAAVSVARGLASVGRGTLGLTASDKAIRDADGRWLDSRLAAVDGSAVLGSWQIYGQAAYSHTDLASGAVEGPAWVLGARRAGTTLTWSAEQRYLAAGFRVENGYLPEVGRITGQTSVLARLGQRGPFRSLQPSARASLSLDPTGSVVGGELGAHAKATLGTHAYGSLDAALSRERFVNADFALWSVSGYQGYNPRGDAEIGLGWSVGTQPHYAGLTATDRFRGLTWTLSPVAQAQLFERLGVALDLTGSQFREDLGGPALYTTWLGRLKANLSLSRAWSLRWIEQGDSYDHSVTSSALISWERTAGTAFYLGYADVWSAEAQASTDESIFAKVSVVGRL